MTERTYDSECLTLAQHFLDDVEVGSEDELKKHAHKLAQEIQQTIEDYIENIER